MTKKHTLRKLLQFLVLPFLYFFALYYPAFGLNYNGKGLLIMAIVFIFSGGTVFFTTLR